MIKNTYFKELGLHVVISRRKGTRNLRLSIKSDGVVKLSIPYGVTEKYAEKFLKNKIDWINKHKKTESNIIPNQHIGKSYRLVVIYKDIEKPRTRLKQNEIVISLPKGTHVESQSVQVIIKGACEKALKKEAEVLLPQRIEQLSKSTGISYKTVKVKKLKSRWGSCDSNKNIVLNIYLMQLDWSLIDYVVLHELAHTYHQHHQKTFWNLLEKLLPDYKERRKLLKSKPTSIIGTTY